MDCKHCDKPAEWHWTDADGNESSDICTQCSSTIAFYMAAPGWQFTPIPKVYELGGRELADDAD